MVIERDVPIPTSDGVVLRADVFRPAAVPVPVIMTLGPYGKGVRYQDKYAEEWAWLVERHPEVLEGSTCRYLTWETVDPERWVPRGYAVVRVDSRGAGRSSGILDCYSAREVQDYAEAIEWAGTRPWCSGRVGLCGISYYAINQWLVASLNPPHLAAIIPWEGSGDLYRERTYHGGILLSGFTEAWFTDQVLSLQHGLGARGPWDPWLNEPATGPESLPPEELAANRVDFHDEVLRHPFDDEWHRSRSADYGRIRVPLLSAANWGGIGRHARGNIEGFTASGSEHKWLEVHTGRHDEAFYLGYALELQLRFFDFFLKGQPNGWDSEPKVFLNVRHADGSTVLRREHEWPLARTRWVRYHVHGAELAIRQEPAEQDAPIAFGARGDGVAFRTDPFPVATEITGPLALHLEVASSTADADLFVVVRGRRPDGSEITFQGANDPEAPLAQGWLRASHRRLDSTRSREDRPYHAHQCEEPLVPTVMHAVEVEVWPTCIIMPVGSWLELVVSGRDALRGTPNRWTFVHGDVGSRAAERYAGTTTIGSGPAHPSWLLVPIVP